MALHSIRWMLTFPLTAKYILICQKIINLQHLKIALLAKLNFNYKKRVLDQ